MKADCVNPLSDWRPFMSYITPALEPRDALPSRRAKRAGKKGGCYLKVRYAEWRIDRLKALAQCTGISLNQITRSAMYEIKERLESALGITADQASAMNLSQRAELGARVKALRFAMMERGVFTIRPAQN